MYYIKKKLSPSEEWVWDVRLMADRYEYLDQRGFIGMIPGFRMTDNDHRELARLIIDAYKEKLKAESAEELRQHRQVDGLRTRRKSDEGLSTHQNP